MKNTLHYCMREQLKGMAIVTISVFVFAFIIVFIASTDSGFEMNLLPGLFWQIFPVYAFVYFFSMQFTFMRKESQVMLSMGETRDHIIKGRQLVAIMSVLEGTIIYLIGEILDAPAMMEFVGYRKLPFIGSISLMIAGLGLGMILSFIERKYGVIGTSISIAIIILSGVLLIFYARFILDSPFDAYRLNAFVIGVLLLAIALYAAGSILSKLDIERMELRV